MADQSRPADDLRNQPADQKLLNEHPELADPSLKGQVAPPDPSAAAPPAPDPFLAQSSRAPAAQGAPVSGQAPNDSKGIPRPFGQAGSEAEKHGYQNARREEQTARQATQAQREADQGGPAAPGATTESTAAPDTAGKRPPLAGRRS
jgi:hypothetical protein